MKYDIELIANYIDGDELIGYDIEELENDIDFMIMVINACNDKRMYNMCSDSLKRNLVFIEYLINKFHNDVAFIEMISEEFMKNASEQEKLELEIILSKYLKYDSSDVIMAYGLSLWTFYLHKMITYELCRNTFTDEYDKEMLAMGFGLILDEYKDSDIIKEYFAKNMLKEIFNGNDLNLEKLLHQRFRNKKKLVNMGINEFLIKYISEYDDCLSGYVAVHVDLLTDLNHKIVQIIMRWNKYEMAKEREKMEIILEEIDKFCIDNMFFVGLELELLKYILIKFNLKEMFLRNNFDLNYFGESFYKSFDDIKDLNISQLNLEMFGKFKKFIDLIASVYYYGVVPDDYIEEVKENDVGDGKILKFEQKK